MRRAFPTFPVLLLWIAVLPATAEVGPVHPDLSGEWVLDPAASDDPAEMTPRPSRGGGRGRGGGGGRGGGMGGRGMRGSDVSGGVDMEKMQQAVEERKAEMQKALARLSILHADPELNITDGNDLTTLYSCDGADTAVWTKRGQRIARALWEAEVLRIALGPPEGGRGPGETTTYMLKDDRLVVTREMLLPGREESKAIRMVYVREGA